MNIVKIFLASSIVEFEQERDKLKREIDALPCENEIQIQTCEDYPDAWTQERKQDIFNEQVRQCDFFFALIGADVGAATLEEIDVAREQFKKSGKAQFPKIVVFFKDLPIEAQSADVIRLKEEIRGFLGQYPPKFAHVGEVTRDILKELIQWRVFSKAGDFEKIRNDHARIEGKIKANRKEIALLYETNDGEINERNQYRLAILYQENADLTREALFEWETLYECASFLHKWGYHLDAIITGTELQALKKRYRVKDEPDDRAALENLLGDCCAALERLEDAERRYRAALDIYRELADAEPDDYSPDLAETCVKLAEICAKTYRFEAAERLYREALECYLRDWEEYASEIAEACRAALDVMGQELDGASDVWRIDVRRAEEAEILRTAEEAFAAYWEYGEETTEEAEAARDKLSQWLDAFPCPDTAAELMTRIEAKARELTQDKPEDYERTLAKICVSEAVWLREHNHMEPAETLVRKSLEINRKLKHERNIAASCNSLAVLLTHTKRPDEAGRRFQEAIEIFCELAQQAPATFEPELTKVYNNLAATLYKINRYAEAEKRYREAIEIQRKLVRQDSTQFEPDLTHFCNNLAVLLVKIKRYGEAEILFHEALKIYRRLARQSPDKFEPDLAMSCNNLAELLRQTGRNQEAETFYREALEVYIRLAAQDPDKFEPNLANSYYNYGLLLLYRKREPAAALAYFNEAIALWEKYPYYETELNEAQHARRMCLGYPGTLTI